MNIRRPDDDYPDPQFWHEKRPGLWINTSDPGSTVFEMPGGTYSAEVVGRITKTIYRLDTECRSPRIVAYIVLSLRKGIEMEEYAIEKRVYAEMKRAERGRKR